ncbi:MAG: hypothetical protein WAV45_04925 [Propionibacteriaceae bacterium]
MRLREHPLVFDRGFAWKPFEAAPGFDSGWWRGRAVVGHIYISAQKGGSEVARIDLNESVWVGDHPGAPDGPDLLEIQFIEVREDLRFDGLGTEIVATIADRYLGRQLVARPTEDAESYWGKHLKWRRYGHRDGSLYPPLFVKPSLGRSGRAARSRPAT